MTRLFIVAVLSIVLAACGSKNNAVQSEDGHAHEVEMCGHDHHGHGLKVAGVAQDGNAASGEITIVKLGDGDTLSYDYSASNPDKIAAWIAGDTVTVFIDHHHHGDHHHDSITAIKIGNHACASDGCAHEHGHAHEHEHEHEHDCGHQH